MEIVDLTEPIQSTRRSPSNTSNPQEAIELGHSTQMLTTNTNNSSPIKIEASNENNSEIVDLTADNSDLFNPPAKRRKISLQASVAVFPEKRGCAFKNSPSSSWLSKKTRGNQLTQHSSCFAKAENCRNCRKNFRHSWEHIQCIRCKNRYCTFFLVLFPNQTASFFSTETN